MNTIEILVVIASLCGLIVLALAFALARSASKPMPTPRIKIKAYEPFENKSIHHRLALGLLAQPSNSNKRRENNR
jgi:hypothetical protein